MADFTVITKGGSVYKMTPYKHAVCTLQYDRVGVSRLTEVGSPNMRTFGAPDTVRLPVQTGKKNMITLTEKMQIWMYQLCRERVPSMPEADAKSPGVRCYLVQQKAIAAPLAPSLTSPARTPMPTISTVPIWMPTRSRLILSYAVEHG